MTDEHRERTLAEAARELALPERTLRRYLDVLRLVREHLVAGRSASEVERLLVERRGRVIDASGAEPAQATLARADFEHQALEVRRLREGVGLLLEHLESERADRARLLDLVEHQAEELAALRREVGQVAKALLHLEERREGPPEAPQGPFHALRRILGFIGFGLFVPFRKEGVEKQLKKTHRAEKSPP